MDQLKDILPPELLNMFKAMDMKNFPSVISSETSKGYKFFSLFTIKSAEFAYENWPTKEGDVFVVTYPKTGTNWSLEILRQILFQDKASQELFKQLPLPLHILEGGPCEKFDILDKLPLSRRLLGSHLPAELVNVEKIKKANAKIIYVLRNPKDQIVSLQKFLQNLPIEESEKAKVNAEWSKYLEHVIAGNFPLGMKSGEWYPDHILGWYKHRDNKNVCFVYFEDLKKDLPREVKKMAEFVGVDLTEETVSKISNACTFANMKKNLGSDDTVHSKMISVNMRKGEVGGWKDRFTVAQSELIDQLMKEKLKETDIEFTYQF